MTFICLNKRGLSCVAERDGSILNSQSNDVGCSYPKKKQTTKVRKFHTLSMQTFSSNILFVTDIRKCDAE